MTKILKVVGASWLQTKISSYILGILGILAILALFAGQIERIQEDGVYAATVFHSDKSGYRIQYWGQSNDLLDLPKGVARAYFRHDLTTTGWSILEIETNGSYPDDYQAYAAGIVEGALTWSLIHAHIENNIRVRCDGEKEKQCNKLKDALEKSLANLNQKASELEDVDPFWHQVSLHYAQIHGIFTGLQKGIEKSLNEYETDKADLYWINAIAEIPELQKKLNISTGSIFDDIPDLASAFLRLTNETAEDGTQTRKLYVAHNAVGSYTTMNRILKRYKFHYHLTSSSDSALVPGVSVEFTGYPGAITSQEDFYILRGQNHRMAVTGTALRNYNDNLIKEISIVDQVPLAARVSAANHLATDVTTWAHVIAANNSGTGSKQWLVVDFDQFDRLSRLTKEEIMDNGDDNLAQVNVKVDNGVRHTVKSHPNKHSRNLLLLIEQVPGRTHTRDISQVLLQQQYWGSIGLPYIKDIADSTHIPRMKELYGNIFSNTDSPRAIAMKQGFKNATNMDNIIKFIRHSNKTSVTAESHTEKEPPDTEFESIIKEESYWKVLGVRGDIVSHHKYPYGVINTKVVCGTAHQKALEFVAIAGPPYSEIKNTTKTSINKGNLALIYTDKFDDQPNINTLHIRNLVKIQQEKVEHDVLEKLNKDIVRPFRWSESDFKNVTHDNLPDKWSFNPFRTKWTW